MYATLAQAAQPTVDTLAWVAPIIQIATAGGFGALVWYLIVKHIPTIEDRHRVERTEARVQFLDTINKHESSMTSLIGEYKQVTQGVTQEMGSLRNLMERMSK